MNLAEKAMHFLEEGMLDFTGLSDTQINEFWCEVDIQEQLSESEIDDAIDPTVTN